MADQPEKIGKYEILGIAGEGSMGRVYAAHDPFTDQKVAIKVQKIPDDGSSASKLARKLFFNEAHTAGELDHPNILAVLDAGEEGNEPYIVMEFVEGDNTLTEYCTEKNQIPLKQAVEFIYSCAKALDYAHRRGVIHRDIKPSNIMLTPKGEAKIADFGIAQRMSSDTTQVMGMLGSPRYMSPEQAQEQDTTHKTDLFSLGVVAYELIAGRPPFIAKGFSRLLYKIVNEDPSPPSEHRPEIPERLNTIILRMLAKNPDDRHETGRELASELVAVFGDLAQVPVEVSEEDQFRIVRKLRFFNDFSDDEIREVLKASAWETRAPGDDVITEGEIDNSFYIIVDGTVSVLKHDKEISMLTKGDCFGEMGYLSKIRRTATITAKDDLSLIKITAMLIEQASITCQLRFNKVFLETLIHRLARTSERLSTSGI